MAERVALAAHVVGAVGGEPVRSAMASGEVRMTSAAKRSRAGRWRRHE
ncbi:hypothetical protein [Terrabacter terrae]